MKVFSVLGFLALTGCMDEQLAGGDDGLGIDASVKATVGEICDDEDNDADGTVDEDCDQWELIVTRPRATWGTIRPAFSPVGRPEIAPAGHPGNDVAQTFMQVIGARGVGFDDDGAAWPRNHRRAAERGCVLPHRPPLRRPERRRRERDRRRNPGPREHRLFERHDGPEDAVPDAPHGTQRGRDELPPVVRITCADDPELCNSVDDDGDGTTDEDCACDPAAEPPSYSADVQPIFTANCLECHSGPDAERDQDLSEGVSYDMIVNVPAVELETMDRIEPGDVENSYLIDKLKGTHRDVGGSGARMPQGGPFLDAATIGIIEAWVEAGALND